MKQAVLMDPRLWIIVAGSVLSLYLIDRFCQRIVGRHPQWSRARRTAARIAMLLLFGVIISTLSFYAASAILF